MNRMTVITAAAAVIVATSLGVGGWAWAQESASEQAHLTVPQLVKAVKPQLNDEQQRSLADGVLTRAEYDAALDRVVGCLQAAGGAVQRVPGRGPGGVDELMTEWRPGSDPRDTTLACYDRHIGKLSMIWAEQHRPTSQQFADHAKALDGCLVASGAAHVAGKSLDAFWEIPEDRAAYVRCLGEVPPPGSAAK